MPLSQQSDLCCYTLLAMLQINEKWIGPKLIQYGLEFMILFSL